MSLRRISELLDKAFNIALMLDESFQDTASGGAAPQNQRRKICTEPVKPSAGC